jgi:hypothetical protein
MVATFSFPPMALKYLVTISSAVCAFAVATIAHVRTANAVLSAFI